MRCAVYGCNVDNRCKGFTANVKFFSFPKDKELQAVWKRLCNREDQFIIKNARVCSKHFSDDDQERNLKHELLEYTPAKYRPLKKDAIPSINLPKMTRQKSIYDRVERQKKERQKKLENILKGVNSSNSSSGSRNHVLCIESPSTSCHNIPDVETLGRSTRNIGVNTDADERDKVIDKLKKKIKFLEERQKRIENLFSDEQLKKLESSKGICIMRHFLE